MTQEDKDLLLKDLCKRLSYGVKILHKGWNYEWDDELSTIERVVGIDEDFIYTKVIDTHNGEEYRDDKHFINTFDDKLFLRPMSSMTDEERQEYGLVLCGELSINQYDWLNAHHFDYHGLIEKGLAIPVTDKNNPYKNMNKICISIEQSKKLVELGIDRKSSVWFGLKHH